MTYFSTEFLLLILCVVTILGMAWALFVLTKDIPKRLYIVVPIPLYLFILVVGAIVYFLLK